MKQSVNMYKGDWLEVGPPLWSLSSARASLGIAALLTRTWESQQLAEERREEGFQGKIFFLVRSSCSSFLSASQPNPAAISHILGSGWTTAGVFTLCGRCPSTRPSSASRVVLGGWHTMQDLRYASVSLVPVPRPLWPVSSHHAHMKRQSPRTIEIENFLEDEECETIMK